MTKFVEKKQGLSERETRTGLSYASRLYMLYAISICGAYLGIDSLICACFLQLLTNSVSGVVCIYPDPIYIYMCIYIIYIQVYDIYAYCTIRPAMSPARLLFPPPPSPPPPPPLTWSCKCLGRTLVEERTRTCSTIQRGTPRTQYLRPRCSTLRHRGPAPGWGPNSRTPRYKTRICRAKSPCTSRARRQSMPVPAAAASSSNSRRREHVLVFLPKREA